MDEKETNRLEAFSDGVFAVAITLLVLNINIPPADKLLDDQQLLSTLSSRWPALLAFVTSFLTIGIMWMNHHRIFNYIKRTDTGLQVINLFLLLIIVFIPVPTALLSDYLVRPYQHTAAIIYSSTFFLMALCFNILWRYAAHNHRLLSKNVDQRAIEAIDRQYVFGPLLYVIAFALAWINTPVSIVFQLLLALFFTLPSHALNALAKAEEIEEEKKDLLLHDTLTARTEEEDEISQKHN